MGSEGPAPTPPCSTRTTVHVTGWKKFHGVPHNPTETIVSNLKEFIKRRGLPLPQGITLGSCTVLEAAADAVLPVLHHILNSTHPDADADVDASSQILESSSSRSNDQVIWLHFGANAGASKFAIERQAVNEASFLFPDEHGWQPQQLSVVPEDGGISQTRQTTCSIEAIVKHLKMKDFDVVISDDADRFVCNYIYYHSLRFAEQKGHKSLLVHVPLFPRIDEDTQMEFAASLLEALALTL